MANVSEEQILVLAPLGRDAELACRTLARAGLDCHPCSDINEVIDRLTTGAAALLVTEEALTTGNREKLLQALDSQPPWSDLPITLLLSASARQPRTAADVKSILPSRNVTILLRPVPTSTLVSVMNAALRARRRQYQLRAHLRAREKRAEDLEQSVQARTRALQEMSDRLKSARDLFYTLFHANPLPIAITRLADGQFIDVNNAYLRYFGYEREQVIGHSTRDLNMWLPTPERNRLVARLREDGSVHNLEMQTAHPSGEPKTALASVEVVELDGIEAALSAFVDITERVRAEEQVRELASALTMAEQTERHRISQVLHDDLQQRLYALQFQLLSLETSLDAEELASARRELTEMTELIQQSIEVARRLSVDLSPPILHDEGLTEALGWLATQMQEQYGIETEVRAEATTQSAPHSFPVPDDGLRVLLFQAVRELLFNVVKHAGAPRAIVTLKRAGERVCIRVQDFGSGFDSDAVLDDGQSGHGLGTIRRRLQMVGGRLEIETAQGQGTSMTIIAPLRQNQQS